MIHTPVRKQLTIRFLHRTVLFLFSFLTALCALFILGNIQNFLDSSQLIILKVLIGTGMLLSLVAGFALLVEAYYVIYLRRGRYLIHCIISVVACVFGLAVAVISAIILLISDGV